MQTVVSCGVQGCCLLPIETRDTGNRAGKCSVWVCQVLHPPVVFLLVLQKVWEKKALGWSSQHYGGLEITA